MNDTASLPVDATVTSSAHHGFHHRNQSTAAPNCVADALSTSVLRQRSREPGCRPDRQHPPWLDRELCVAAFARPEDVDNADDADNVRRLVQGKRDAAPLAVVLSRPDWEDL